MSKKQLFSFALAFVMALTLTTPSFAEDEELTPPEEIGEVQDPVENVQEPEEDVQDPVEDVQEPEEDVQDPVEDVQDPEPEPEPDPEPEPMEDEPLVDVVVPSLGNVVLNPYSMPVKTETGKTREQVIHQAQSIMNYSAFPVTVNATVTGSLDGDAWLVPAPPDPDGLDKELFLYVEFGPDAEHWRGEYTGAPDQLLVTEVGSAGEGVLVLDGGSEGYFRLFGAMTPYPDSMWSSENALSVTISYTFTRADAGEQPLEPDEVTDPEPLPEPDEVTDPEPSPEPDEVTDPEPSPEPDEVTDPEPYPEPDEVTDPEPSPEPDEVTDPEPSPEPDDETDPEPSPEPDEVTDPGQPAEPDDSVPPPGTPAPLNPEGEETPAD